MGVVHTCVRVHVCVFLFVNSSECCHLGTPRDLSHSPPRKVTALNLGVGGPLNARPATYG